MVLLNRHGLSLTLKLCVNDLIKHICIFLFQAGLSRVYSNHSIRATSITLLDDSGIEARHIMRVSGHKNEASIRSYASRLNDTKKREISDCLTAAVGTNQPIGTMSHPPPESSHTVATSDLPTYQVVPVPSTLPVASENMPNFNLQTDILDDSALLSMVQDLEKQSNVTCSSNLMNTQMNQDKKNTLMFSNCNVAINYH